MLIDWFTVAAQALNFLILVWLMRRFLYQPILNAIDTREKGIAAEHAAADAKKAEAQKDRDDFQHKNEVFDQQRAALLNEATDTAKAEGQRQLDEVRQTAEALGAKQKETLRSEVENLHQSLRCRAQQEVFSISRKALTDLAGASLEARMVDVFCARLRALTLEQKALLIASQGGTSDPTLIQTTFDLPSSDQTSVESAVHALLGPMAPIQFQTTPNLISGIELLANGQKVAWSIDDYLATLKKGVDDLLKANDESDVVPQDAPNAVKSDPKSA